MIGLALKNYLAFPRIFQNRERIGDMARTPHFGCFSAMKTDIVFQIAGIINVSHSMFTIEHCKDKYPKPHNLLPSRTHQSTVNFIFSERQKTNYKPTELHISQKFYTVIYIRLIEQYG